MWTVHFSLYQFLFDPLTHPFAGIFCNCSQDKDQNRYDIQTKNTTDAVGVAVRYHCLITIPGNIMNHAVVWAENKPMFVSANKHGDEKPVFVRLYE